MDGHPARPTCRITSTGRPSPWHAVASAATRSKRQDSLAVDEGRRWDEVAGGRVRRARRRPRRLAAAARPAGRVPPRRRPHRLARPARQAATGRAGDRRLATARRRGVRRDPQQHLARPRPRGRRPGGVDRRIERRWSTSTSPSPACRSWRCTSTGRSTSAGCVLDRQTHLAPVWGVGPSDVGGFAAWLAEHAGSRRPRLVGAVPLRRAALRRARRRPVAARQRPDRQPGVVLGRRVGARSMPPPAPTTPR